METQQIIERGRVIFYDVNNGQILEIIPSMRGPFKPKTIDEYISMYPLLRDRDRDSYGHLELDFGQYDEDFAQANGYWVNPGTRQLEFSYPDPNTPDPEQPPMHQKPLTEQIENLQRENTELKLALTELAETNESDKLNMQLAITELAELVVGGDQVG
ncbi:hypothetical protein GRF59_15270 [Paenibacillus sp. HJL G12]|uniref:Uncharacterized protein n=1 Tax=Paenibacillus dendrobii TaxID=2691084 RepID=A0A7X3IJ87_9BACL|nr:hypothetical protein [Paenibacillus dendrobii]MWV44982.1 hypothetical protein [Paenibacillus dendrobii]